jgi:quercetin dioxygenase-like cupin family protein
MIVDKPWGYEHIWAKTDKYVGKLIHINPNSRLSLQYHNEKQETIYVLKGNLSLDLEDSSMLLLPGDTYHIPPGLVHRFGALDEEVELMEVSTTELNDVVRIQDDYKRLSTTP